MSTEKNSNQPLAEVFGFSIDNQSERAIRYRENKLCPFNNIVSNCTKNSIEFPCNSIQFVLSNPLFRLIEKPGKATDYKVKNLLM